MKHLIYILVLVLTPFASHGNPIPAQRLFVSPDISALKLSPDTRYFASYDNAANGYYLSITDTENRHKQRLMKFDNAVGWSLRSYYWIDNDTIYLDMVGTKQKTAQTQALLHINYDNGKAKPKLKTVSVEGFLIDPMEKEKGRVLYAVPYKRSGHDYFSLYSLTIPQLESGVFDKSDKSRYSLKKAITYVTDLSNSIIWAATRDGSELQFWFKKRKEGSNWEKIHLLKEGRYEFIPVGPLSNGKFAVISNKKGNFLSVYEFDIKKQEFGEILYQHPKYDLAAASVNPADGMLNYVQFYDHGKLITKYFSSEDERLHKLVEKAFKGKQVIVVSEKPGYSKKIIEIFSSDDPGRYYLFDTDKLHAELIGASYSNLDKYKLSPSEVFTVDISGSESIEAILTRPKGYSNGVLLVMPHGGPVGVQDIDEFDAQTQFFASRGYSLLKINFRGSSGYGKKFLSAGVASFGKVIEDDISKAVDVVRSQYDFKHMCSIGASYGGYSAVMLAMKKPELYDCVVASYGVYDLPLIYNYSNLTRRGILRKRIENTLGEMRDELWDLSPLYNAEELKSPILLIAGKKDEVSGIEQSNRFKYRLKQVSSDLETLFYEKAGHGTHETWYGDRHEAIYIDDFIRRKLDLKMPPDFYPANLLISEAISIADHFHKAQFLPPNDARAFKFYLVAAQLGNARAQYKVAQYYDGLKESPSSRNTALNWYKKASENGYEPAITRLEEMQH